ncbi:molybdate ABC transporter permease subunit [Streptomyces calidiresistens]|uniref:Molybdate ABC transporter permease subunit n=1 Tax=Streptomyces calidiresistens TaxID=1485586 RepID=A0A7W3XXB8_9ACTN|nr:molybdate ABC transporter permease subunit [Streptomyces calidiresistens]
MGRPPVALLVPALLAVALLALPLVGVLARTPWSELGSHLGSPAALEALRLSLVVSGWSLLLSLVLGVPLAWMLARVPFRGRAVVRSLVLLPMVLPPTVGGVALLTVFGRRGLLGPWLKGWFGLTLPFHTSGAVLAATFVSMPFLVISLEGALAGLRPGYEETAASLGASPARVFVTVTLPLVAPGLAAGAALTWARALGEFGATITFAGNLPGTTQTLPLRVYLLLQEEPEAAVSVSLLLLVVAMAVLVALRGRWTGPVGHGALRSAEREPDPAGDGGTDDEGSRAAGAAVPTPVDGTGAGADTPPAGTAATGPLRARVRGLVEAELIAEPGTTIAVVGPNGAGKTTLLRALLGISPLARASVRFGDRDVTDEPAHRRRVAWVPQDGALFPHLSALANAAYGPRARGVGRRRARETARRRLTALGVAHLADRRPAQLSGGQAQRVALARALAGRPDLLLLDEPLAALDQSARAVVRQALRTHLAGFDGVCLIVTHDPVEAVALADRVLVLEDGRAVQDAPPAEVVRHPASPWVARMLGLNAWPGRTTEEGLEAARGVRLVAAEPLPADRPALAVFAPETVALYPPAPGPPPHGSPRNTWPATVREVATAGGRVRVTVLPDPPGDAGTAEGRAEGPPPEVVAEITPAAAAELRPVEGGRVVVVVKATEVRVVPL